MIYFDHNATTPLHPVARDAWLAASEKFIGNPASPHRLGARAEHAIEGAREKLAGIIGCDAHEIIWTSGATDSNNMALNHFARSIENDREIWISAIEHPSVIEPARFYFPKNLRLIPVSHSGIIDLDWLRDGLKQKEPALVALLAANNETGVLQPWRETLALCREFRVPFFCDAAQWIGKLPAREIGLCDFVAGCAHKFGGPKGVGFLKIPRGKFHALIRGGSQEQGRRAGTENVAGVAAMMAILESREAKMNQPAIDERLAWRADFENALLEKMPEAQIVGIGTQRLWNTVSVVMPSGAQRRWVTQLDKLGFAVSTGSACASGREEPSHVLAAMGISPEECKRVLRFSSGWETTDDDWQSLAAKWNPPA